MVNMIASRRDEKQSPGRRIGVFETYETLQPMSVNTSVSEEEEFERSAGKMAPSLYNFSACRISSPLLLLEGTGTNSEKRQRRQIANSNERRRMQSINTGFQTLRALLPAPEDGEKMSKASILQQTAQLIFALQADKEKLVERLDQLTRRQGPSLTPNTNPKAAASDVAVQTNPTSNNDIAVETATSTPCTSAHESSPKPSREILAPPKKRKLAIPDDTTLAESSNAGVIPATAAMDQPTPSPAGVIVVAHTPHSHQHNNDSTLLPTATSPQLVTTSAAQSDVSLSVWQLQTLHTQLLQMRLALDRERRLRLLLEEEMRKPDAAAPLPLLSGLPTARLLTGLTDFGHWTASRSTTTTPISTPGPYVTASPSPVACFTAQGAVAPTTPTNTALTPTIINSTLTPSFTCTGPTGHLAAPPSSAIQYSHQPISTTKQSLDAIVEAIKHLEGDRPFVGGRTASSHPYQVQQHFPPTDNHPLKAAHECAANDYSLAGNLTSPTSVFH